VSVPVYRRNRASSAADSAAEPAPFGLATRPENAGYSEGKEAMQFLVRLHRFSRALLDRGWRRLSRLVELTIRLVFAARIPADADIDPTVHFSHNALAVVVTKRARIGPRCQIGMHVLLGSRWPLEGGPRLEADVVVHAGAKIIGPITVGQGSVIGANAVVLEDIPPRSLAVGVPAVVKKAGIRIEDYRIPADIGERD
jgi:serine O-acetyltransferase